MHDDFNIPATWAQHLENLPEELLKQPRFFAVGADKIPHVKEWNLPENQSLPGDVTEEFVGFDTCGHDDLAADYLLVDCDHVLNKNGDVLPCAEKWINYLLMAETYSEISRSGDGVHFFFKPTPGKFPKMTGSAKCSIFLDDNNPNVKIELFYKQSARYCLVTGNLYQCKSANPIADGEVADDFFQHLINELPFQHTVEDFYSAAVDYPPLPTDELIKILSYLPCEDKTEISRDDWWKIGAIIEYEYGEAGFEIWRQWSENDSARYSYEACRQQWQDCIKRHKQGLGRPAKIGTLIYMAKKFGYKPPRPKCPDHLILSPELKKKLYSGELYDYDFAHRLITLFPNSFRYMLPDGCWYLFNRNDDGGGVWKNFGEKKAVIFPFAKILSETLIANADPPISDEQKTNEIKEREKFRDHQLKLGKQMKTTKYISSAVEYMKGCKDVIIKADDLDKNPYLFNVQNGVIDLTNGDLLQAAPDLFLSQQSPVIYRKGYYNPDVTDFLLNIIVDPNDVTQPDEDTIEALLILLGSCLTGDTCNHKAAFFWGRGRNGKGTLTRLLQRVFGVDYSCSLDIENFLVGAPRSPGAPNADFFNLRGRRLACVEELKQSRRLDVPTLKKMTGGDRITARALHQNYLDGGGFDPTHHLIFSGNKFPTIDDVTDPALISRLLNFGFYRSFADNPDLDLDTKLSTPEALSGMLSYLVYGCRKWLDRSKKLLITSAMENETIRYLHDNDWIQSFIDENCLLVVDDPTAITTRKDFIDKLKEAHEPECKQYRRKKELQDIVTKKLADNGVRADVDRHNQAVFVGIKLTDK